MVRALGVDDVIDYQSVDTRAPAGVGLDPGVRLALFDLACGGR